MRLSASRRRDSAAVEAGLPQHRAAAERRECGGRCLPNSGDVRHGTLERDEECRSRQRGPNPRAAHKDGRERDAIGRPHRPEIAAADMGGGLAELAGDVIGGEDNKNLDDPSAKPRSVVCSPNHLVTCPAHGEILAQISAEGTSGSAAGTAGTAGSGPIRGGSSIEGCGVKNKKTRHSASVRSVDPQARTRPR